MKIFCYKVEGVGLQRRHPSRRGQAWVEFFFFGLEPMQADSAIEMNAAII